MRSLAEINAENDALVERADSARKAAIRRLKQRIARVSWRFDRLTPAAMRLEINQCIDEWFAAEEKRR